MSKAGKITAAISGAFLLLIVVAIILIATFDWNRLKPTINQKVSAELNRSVRYPWRSGRGVGAAKTRNWLAQLGAVAPCTRGRHHSWQSTGYSRSHDGAFATRRGNAGPAGAADQNGPGCRGSSSKSPTRA
ncbi:putative outer membrane assembly protein [Escherichia coli]|uniref:Putative outer membrane assembly protein n=1 Tax=Escherichia coli TaxID=562 RepID=A0A376NWG6_ECOLX|nr:putative outer membrane assembly protein [Escherichia coli]